MAMFDPAYVTEVLNDILGRRGQSAKNIQAAAGSPEFPKAEYTDRKEFENGTNSKATVSREQV